MLTLHISLVLLLALSLPAAAAPLNITRLAVRAPGCTDKSGPCICNDSLGLRNEKPKCPGSTFKFALPDDSTDGALTFVDSNLGIPDLQCDHVVELQFLKAELDKLPAVCTTFQNDPNAYQQFFDFINSGNNLVDIPKSTNNAKGQLFGGKTLRDTTSKAANGVVAFLTALRGNEVDRPGTAVAQRISDELDRHVGQGNGFTNFQALYDAKVDSVIDAARTQAPKLDPFVPKAAKPGDIFCNKFPQDFQRNKKRDEHERRQFGDLIDGFEEVADCIDDIL